MARIAQASPGIWASLEKSSIQFAARHGLRLLRLSLGIVFLWFALPKFKPGLSAVDTLARDTIDALTGHLISGSVATFLLATLETAIGLGFLTGRFLRPTLIALMCQMVGTLTPLALFPHRMWKTPFVLSLEGQFIAKNLVLIAAGIAVAGTLHKSETKVVQPAAAAASSRTPTIDPRPDHEPQDSQPTPAHREGCQVTVAAVSSGDAVWHDRGSRWFVRSGS